MPSKTISNCFGRFQPKLKEYCLAGEGMGNWIDLFPTRTGSPGKWAGRKLVPAMTNVEGGRGMLTNW